MELNTERKNKLRKEIEELLEDVPEGKRIHINNNDMLNELLYDTVSFEQNNSTTIIKLPVWSGEFLRKIDLSEVDFEDVSWSLFHDEVMIDEIADALKMDYNNPEYIELYNSTLKKAIPWYSDNCPKINYSETNANIDFTKSFEYKKRGTIRLDNCDFSGNDLSSLDASKLQLVYDCDLSNTGLKLSPETVKPPKNNDFDFIGATNFTNVDLSSFTVDIVDVFKEESYFWDNCNFTNTGLRVIVDPDRVKKAIEETFMFEDDYNDFMTRLSGCYVNGKKVLSTTEKNEIEVNRMLEEENQSLNSVTSISEESDNSSHK